MNEIELWTQDEFWPKVAEVVLTTCPKGILLSTFGINTVIQNHHDKTGKPLKGYPKKMHPQQEILWYIAVCAKYGKVVVGCNLGGEASAKQEIRHNAARFAKVQWRLTTKSHMKLVVLDYDGNTARAFMGGINLNFSDLIDIGMEIPGRKNVLKAIKQFDDAWNTADIDIKEKSRGYVPSSLKYEKERKKFTHVMYAIGYEHSPHENGMAHGPTPSLKQMLDIVPNDNTARLFRFGTNGKEKIIYTWCDDRWMPVES